MQNNLLYLISAKVEDIAKELARRNSIEGIYVEARLEGDTLSIYLKPLDRGEAKEISTSSVRSDKQADVSIKATPSTRATGRRRNRMKTRGWNVVGKITNRYGVTSNVYLPFVEALENVNVSRSEQRSIVAKILRSNGNSPSADSIEYFLDNTLEFLAQKRAKET